MAESYRLGEGGDEGIEGPIIMHSALLDPGREKGKCHYGTEYVCIFKYGVHSVMEGAQPNRRK